MHKHERKKRGWKNSNRRISRDCRNRLVTLVEGIQGESVALDYLRTCYLSKFNGEGTASARERKLAAIRKWRVIDQLNADTNRRLRAMDRGYNILPRVTWFRFLQVAQSIISNVLGDLRNEITIGTFTGGASTSRSRVNAAPAAKYDGMADVTQGATPFVDLIHQQSELFREYQIFYSLNEVEGAELFTVPKNSDIDRCACKEPDINMFLQKGVGNHIRRRLRRHGMNLNDQSRNRSLARVGSITGELATLDLSAASDSVATMTVLSLLPHDWYLYLNDIRSQHVQVNGSYVMTGMFSSMGNGFTFELESLLFFAIAKATLYLRGHPGILSVYGDDIIVPSQAYDDVTWVLSVFGFTVNPDKSFAAGPFRESCGGHYHHGEDITPFFLRREPTHLTDVIRVANQLRRWATTVDWRQYEHPGLYDLWREIASYVPKGFWGGHDLEVDTQLASPDSPKYVLRRISEDKETPPAGEYIHWHVSNRNRITEPDEQGFRPVDTSLRCRTRDAKPGALTVNAYFREELS